MPTRTMIRRCGAVVAAYAVALQAILSALVVVPLAPAAGFSAGICHGAADKIPAIPSGDSDTCCVVGCCSGDAASAALPVHASAPLRFIVVSVREPAWEQMPARWPSERPRLSRAPPV